MRWYAAAVPDAAAHYNADDYPSILLVDDAKLQLQELDSINYGNNAGQRGDSWLGRSRHTLESPRPGSGVNTMLLSTMLSSSALL